MEFGIFLVIVVLGGVVFMLIRNRRKQAQLMTDGPKVAAGTELSTVRDLFDPEVGHHAPVADFHVHGNEARVTFDVPLGDEDPILNDLLVDEAIEVVRQKKHTLPIDDVEHVVVFAGTPAREVGRTSLPSPGELPPPGPTAGLSFTQIARDPFASPFDEEVDHSIHYQTKSDTPPDELPPLYEELKIPLGLQRGLRTNGVDPEKVDGPDLVLALLKLFGYKVSEQAYEGSYMALKDGLATYLVTDSYKEGDYPELDEAVIRRFLADFGSSGADRGILITDKYSPFIIHEIEGRQPKIRFITRERVQGFIDSMALG